MFALKRPLHDITRFSVQSSVWCRQYRMILWDVGNFHGTQTAASLLNKDYMDRSPTPADRERAFRLAPQLTRWYREQYPELSPEGAEQDGERGAGGAGFAHTTGALSSHADIGGDHSSPKTQTFSDGTGILQFNMSRTDEHGNVVPCDPRGGMCDQQQGKKGHKDLIAATSGSEWLALVEKLMAMVRARARNNRIVFVMASANWEILLLNWVCRVHDVGIENYIIFAADDELYEKVSRRIFFS